VSDGRLVNGLPARRPGLLVLVDPGRTTPAAAAALAREAAEAGAAALLIGSSFDGTRDTAAIAGAMRAAAPTLPLLLFPGSAMQLTDQVDAVLFLSLVSGRNPQYLIEEHVRAVPFLQRHPVPTVSTGYILIDGGRVTSVEAVSQTRPLPSNRPELAAAHARAACLIGMRAVYLDAGSGAARPVPGPVIAACREAAPDVALLVGGGIRTPEAARAARVAGADFVVVGTALEGGGSGGGGGEGPGIAALVRAVTG
jgi:putative glycerol-1-phosphate prenyltransferase